MAARKYPGRADDVRRAILAVAQPGKPLPRLAEIGASLGISQPAVSWHLDRLREQGHLVTREVAIPQRRLLVLGVWR